MSCDLDGGDTYSQVAIMSGLSGDNPIFGLTIYQDRAYISVWKRGLVVSVNLNTRAMKTAISTLGYDNIFSLYYADENLQEMCEYISLINSHLTLSLLAFRDQSYKHIFLIFHAFIVEMSGLILLISQIYFVPLLDIYMGLLPQSGGVHQPFLVKVCSCIVNILMFSAKIIRCLR